jgi:hypothetical protein
MIGRRVTNVRQPDFFGNVLANLPNGTKAPEAYAGVVLKAIDITTAQVRSHSSVRSRPAATARGTSSLPPP